MVQYARFDVLYDSFCGRRCTWFKTKAFNTGEADTNLYWIMEMFV